LPNHYSKECVAFLLIYGKPHGTFKRLEKFPSFQ